MDLIQLYTSTQNVTNAIEASGLMSAVKIYRQFLNGASSEGDAETQLNEATSSYMSQVGSFGVNELAVLERLSLTELHAPSFWFDLTGATRSREQRQSQLVAVYSKLMFASGQLPGLLGLVREVSAVESLKIPDSKTGAIALRVYDSIESSSDPERLARLIDGLDMIYEACAVLAGKPPRGLKLMSVSGLAYRTLVFHGHKEPVTATRRIIRSLNERAENDLPVGNTAVNQDEEASALERLCAELPFMYSLDELYRVGAISSDVEEQIRRGVMSGSIMLVEAKAELTDFDDHHERAKIDADADSFDLMDQQAERAIEDEYLKQYQYAKQQFIEDAGSEAKSPKAHANLTTDVNATGGADNDGGDELDALVHDLRKRYTRKGKPV